MKRLVSLSPLHPFWKVAILIFYVCFSLCIFQELKQKFVEQSQVNCWDFLLLYHSPWRNCLSTNFLVLFPCIGRRWLKLRKAKNMLLLIRWAQSLQYGGNCGIHGLVKWSWQNSPLSCHSEGKCDATTIACTREHFVFVCLPHCVRKRRILLPCMFSFWLFGGCNGIFALIDQPFWIDKFGSKLTNTNWISFKA